MISAASALQIFYDSMFVLSLLLMFIYLALWHRHFDVHLMLLYVLVPVANFAYTVLQRSTDLGSGLIAKKLTYVGGCFLMLLMTLLVFSLCKIELKRWVRLLMVFASLVVFLSALSAGMLPIFYDNMVYSVENGAVRVTGDAGFMHTAFYVLIIAYFLLMLGALAYSMFRKTETSQRIVRMLMWPVVVCVLIFFLERPLFPQVELLPLAYNFAMFMNLFIAHRLCLYDITSTAVDSLIENGDAGIVSFDFKFRYLGSNETAKKYLPALRNAKIKVDDLISKDENLRKSVLPWLTAFKTDGKQNRFTYTGDGRIYRVDVGYLLDHTTRRGYQLYIADDTENVAHITLLENYNEDLRTEVEKQTEHIVRMNDKFVLAMATMVESRDNSTGGHIRRTSDGIRILLEELKTENPEIFTDKFCSDLAKAAPMHDLGKIAVDDAVLRKPGRYTPEEFEQMKVHAAEGAKIVRNVLEGTNDPEFRKIAENVAHYHHERWDGSGYPDGLKERQIPLEARVMAVADVYDALVSKRVYKEKMTFESAESIILEGMGKHFDPSLESAFRKAEPKLEAYYTALEQSEGQS